MSSPTTLEETLLYKKLNELVSEDGLNHDEKINRQKALDLVNIIHSKAIESMKTVIRQFNEYTLHDEVHLVNVTHIMGIILKESKSIDNLSYIEITILILSAYLHDIGMAAPKDKLNEIINSDEFKLFRKNKKNEIRELNQFEELLSTLSDEDKPPLRLRIAEIEQSIITEYLRKYHGDLGAEYIIQKGKNKEIWELENHNISEIVSLVCKGHSLDPQQLTNEYKNKYLLNKRVGTEHVNILYCTLILRLADILDFDRKRTPSILYENISPSNEISVAEWNKHASVTGWEISQKSIVFECECSHPVYEKTLREFLDYIDAELKSCLLIVKDFPKQDGIADKYQLILPQSVDRSRIFAKGDSYSYIDLQFTLSHEEIMNLLMGEDLWGGPSLCIRELIQNSYDAIRHRKAKEKAEGNNWTDGEITLIQRLNSEGKLELICKDNGIGMDEHILKDYFFKIGRSYYRSPEFEQERFGLKGKNADFDPVSQFGIGVLSTFMVGESLKIHTQRYLGPYKGCKDRLEVEVNGISKMVIMKKVLDVDPKPGTEIIVTGKELTDEEISEDYREPIQLLGTVQYYAAALDIPINIIIKPPFNPCNLTIEPPKRPLNIKTRFEEEIPSEDIITLEKNFKSLSRDYEGIMKMSFLKDPNGKICMANKWGKWDKVKDSSNQDIELIRCDGKKLEFPQLGAEAVAQDGILIGSDHSKRSKLHFWGPRSFAPELRFPGSYFINITGEKKLPLKPNRSPYSSSPLTPSNEGEKKWGEFSRELKKFSRTILNDILSDALQPDPEDFWRMVEVYDLLPYELLKNIAYDHIPFPYIENNDLNWMTLNEMCSSGLKYISLNEYPLKPYPNTAYIPVKNIYSVLKKFGYELWGLQSFKESITSIIRASTLLQLENCEILYQIKPMTTPFKKVGETLKTEPFNYQYYQIYGDEQKNYLYINNPAGGVNYLHPVIRFISDLNHNSFTWFKAGLENFVRNLANDSDFYNKKPNEWTKDTKNHIESVMYFWKKVDWNLLPDDIKPPYKLLFPTTNVEIDVSPEYLEQIMGDLGIKNKKVPRKLFDLT